MQMVHFRLYFFKLNAKGGAKHFDTSKKNLNTLICNKHEK